MIQDMFPYGDAQPARWRALCARIDAWERFYLARHVAYFRAKRLAMDKATRGKLPPVAA